MEAGALRFGAMLTTNINYLNLQSAFSISELLN